MFDVETIENYIKEGWLLLPLYGVNNGVCECYKKEKCTSPGKHPITKTGVKEATNNKDVVLRWLEENPGCNLGGACSNFVVLDIDERNGADTTAIVKALPRTRFHASGSGVGGHLVYRKTNANVKASVNKVMPGVDVKTGVNHYVVLPGSVHAAGGKYRNDKQEITTVPNIVVELINNTSFSKFLFQKPGVGGRNNWLTKVAGTCASRYRDDKEMYLNMVSVANLMLLNPLGDDEVSQVASSIERAEKVVSDRVVGVHGLTSFDGETLDFVDSKGNKHRVGNFNITANGKAMLNNESLIFDVNIQSKNLIESIKTTIDGNTIGSSINLQKWLANKGLVLAIPPSIAESKSNGDWLLLYLLGQNQTDMLVVNHIGYDVNEKHFVTPDKLITSKEIKNNDVILNNSINVFPYKYGFGHTKNKAKKVLKEIISFQDETVSAVFASWWSACFVKSAVMLNTASFPIVAVEAASGSGKTTGFFELMVALSGYTKHAGIFTPAALRTLMQINSSGIVWVDDMNDTDGIQEIIRTCTAEGELNKMSPNNTNVTSHALVSTMLLSGEMLGGDDQKAIIDRVVRLRPIDPSKRKSLHNPKKPQWNDVIKIRQWAADNDGLQSLTGWIVKHMVEQVDNGNVKKWADKVRAKSKRLARKKDTEIVLMIGALLLESFLDEPGKFVPLVRSWLLENVPEPVLRIVDGDREIASEDNTLNLKIVPWALAEHGWSDDGVAARGGKGALIDKDGIVWINVTQLAQNWAEYNKGRVNKRTETKQALQLQLTQLGLGSVRKRIRVTPGRDGTSRWFVSMGVSYSKDVIELSQS